MIFNFRLVSDEVDNFRREISIDADATFLDLRNAICDSVDYDKNQMCSFFRKARKSPLRTWARNRTKTSISWMKRY